LPDITFPCLEVQMVPAEKVQANDYNPNKVATPEMELLRLSIEEDGLTQPIVVCHDPDLDRYIVVDGFHRYALLANHFKCPEIPVVVIAKDIKQRMAATIRHNRARGKHQVDLMSELVRSLYEKGWEDERIAEHLGMSVEELLRLKQMSGAAKLLAGSEYSAAWGEIE